MELPNLKSKKFLVFCIVSIILVMTLVWLSHHKPFEYSANKVPKPRLDYPPGALMYPVTGGVNREAHPLQTVSRVFPTLSNFQTGIKAQMDNRNGRGKDTHDSNMPAKNDAGNDKVLTDAGTQKDAPKPLQIEAPTNGAVRVPPMDTHASNMPGAKIDPVNDKVQTFLRDGRTQKDAPKPLQTETQTNGAVRVPPMDTHTSNMPGAKIDPVNDKVQTFLRDGRTQKDAPKPLQLNTPANATVTRTRVWPTTNVPTEQLTSPTTTIPTTPTTVTTVPPTLPPVSLRLPSGRMVTPERLSLPESRSDLVVTVRTAESFGESRLSLTFLTWLQTVDPKQVHIVTDSGAGKWFSAAKKIGIDVVETNCPQGHGQTALCCKSGTELEQYYLARDRGENVKWFCHSDDDVYMNVPNMIKKLHSYNPSEKRYLGYWLTNLWGQGRMTNGNYDNFPGHVRRGYYYGDGPCYCMSAALMDAAEQYFRGKDRFVSACSKANLPEDDTVGLINDAVLDVPLTHVNEMNTERTPRHVPPGEYKDQITFGYSIQWNVRINPPNQRFGRSDDPSGEHTLFVSRPSAA